MVPRLVTSPRAQRRILTTAGAVAAVAALAGATQFLPGGKDFGVVAAPAGHAAAQPPPPVRAAPKPVPLARRDRLAIDDALERSVPAAVRRADPASAYDLVTPALRAGTTRRD